MKRTSDIPIFSKNCWIVPIRSPRDRSLSATSPSTWWNSARWVLSTVSLRNTRSIEKYRRGSQRPDAWVSCATFSSIREETAVVWVRSRFFSDSERFQL